MTRTHCRIGAMLAVLIAQPVLACVTTTQSSYPLADSITVVYNPAMQSYVFALSSGMDMWNQGCGFGGGDRYPRLSFDSGPRLTINLVGGHAAERRCADNTQYCAAEWDPSTRTLTVYEQFGDPNNLFNFTNLTDAQRSNLFAHEIGHALGLAHSWCTGGLMNPGISSGSSLAPEECDAADRMNNTEWERITSDPCSPWPDCEESPILIDLLHDGYRLTDTDGGVWFDLDGDGTVEQVSWTSPGSDEAFLWLDQNDNGVVDHGLELFGSFLDGNGFVTLARWDQGAQEDVDFGGDGNGVIDGRDRIWPRLRLWVDANHNGVSEESEIFTLDEKGVRSIDLAFRTSERVDRHGNRFRYRSMVSLTSPSGGTRQAQAYDVFFVVER